jgi:hypothetical protein
MTNKQTFNQDIQKLEYLYTPTQIIDQLKTTKELISNEVCELVAKRPNFFKAQVTSIKYFYNLIEFNKKWPDILT